MELTDLLIQRIVAVLGMCLWLVFPIGMFISVIRQDQEALPPKKIEDYQLHPAFHEDPFAGVKVDSEKEFTELKIDDFSHQHVSIRPGPDNKHTEV